MWTASHRRWSASARGLRLAGALLVLLGVLCGRASVARAECPPGVDAVAAMDEAVSAYIMRDFAQVVTLVAPLVEAESCLESREGRVEAHLLLGTAYFQLDELGLAELEFLSLFRLDATFDLDNVELPSRATRQFIETLRRDDPEVGDTQGGTSGGGFETYYVTIEKQRNQFWINFVPFGAGQFQNGDDAWGWVYLSVESLALMSSVAGAIAVEVIRGESFTFTREEAQAARAWQTVQLASAGIFLGVYAAGVIHAIVTFEPTETLGVLPPTKDRPAGVSDASSVGPQVLVGPQLAPGGGGIAVHITF